MPYDNAFERGGHLPNKRQRRPTDSRRPHKVMTPEEYAEMKIIGWHEVCRDVDGFGGVGVRFIGTDQT